MQTLTCYYIKIVEFNYDMRVFNQVTDGHICCYKLIIQVANPIESSLLTFVCYWGNKLHLKWYRYFRIGYYNAKQTIIQPQFYDKTTNSEVG